LIQAVDVEKTYPDGTAALQGLNLSVERGEMLLIRGPSGAGKTTLFRLILGMERPTSGAVFIDDQRIDANNPGRVRALRRRVGVIFQNFRLIKGRTARENVEIGLRVLGVTGGHMRGRAEEYLRELDLAHRIDARVDSLSWGEQQRVAVARALAREPEIILADEPTGNLDEALSDRVLELLSRVRERGATVLVAIHSPDVLRKTALRVISLKSGRLVGDTHPPAQKERSRS